MQSYNGTGTNYRTDSGFNNPDYYTIQDMKIIIITFLLGLSFWIIPSIIIYAIQLDFLLRYWSTISGIIKFQSLLTNRRIVMSDEAQDIYPLTVEEYESAEVVAQDVEVE